jgi:hypothetical protein
MGLTAYRAYSGEALPAARVARVEFWHQQGVRLLTVDGASTSGSGWHGAVAVWPGRHALGVEVMWSNRMRQRGEVAWDAEAGRTYHVRVQEYRPAREQTFAGEMLQAMAEGAVHGAAPAIAPFAMAALLIPPPKDPPAGHVMTAWVAEEELEGRPVGTSWSVPAGQVLEYVELPAGWGGRKIKRVGLPPRADGRGWERVK